MRKNILFAIDDLELKSFEFNDLITDFWLIKEFLKRGYEVFAASKSGLFIEKAQGFALAYAAYLKDENIFCSKEKTKYLINDFDTVFFRPDPPVDVNYINACYVFDFVDRRKTFLINDPSEVRNFSEKLHINYFPQYVPENIVTADKGLIADFIAAKKEAVLKPLNRCFGSGVYYLNAADKNLPSIIDDMTKSGASAVMVQEYIHSSASGDKRILLIGSRVMKECIQKLPPDNNFKFAEHSDKYFAKTELTEKEQAMAQDIAEKLARTGINSAGLDVINEKVIEINVTSPCYFIREINQNYGIHFENKIMLHLEALINNHFESAKPYALN